MNSSFLRRLFWFLNKFLMVPMFRLGFGPIVGNPFTGYIMVIKTTGRKTGKTRYTPVNYAIYQGDLYCIAGWGQISDWYRNIQANRIIDVIHPNRSLAGSVDEVADPVKKIKIMRMVLKNAGFAGFFEGFNPFNVADEVLEQKIGKLPLLRIHPIGLGSGASDPTGWGWICVWIAIIMLAFVFFGNIF